MSDLKNKGQVQLLWLVSLLLTMGTLACYWPVNGFGFVNLDDPLYVYETKIVTRGLTWPGFVWAFHSVQGGNWNPLVWLSHMAACQIFKLNPGGHHLINLLLHIANVLLLFLLLRQMTGAIWRSGFVAALFAWHPMHVESVAWISERKDVLSTLFWLLTMCAYARYVNESKVQSPKSKVFYGLALLCFALGLMSKPMLVTLPFVLLLMDYWPLGRICDLRLTIDEQPTLPSSRKSYTRPARSCVGVVNRKLILEKLPFFFLAAAASMVAVWTQRSAGAMGTEPLPLRLENVAVSYVAYVEKFFWPGDLAVFYPFPDSIPLWQVIASTLLLGVISGAVIWNWKQRPYLAAGWFWFLGTLVPVIGLMHVGMQAMADRYTYVPFIGLSLMLAWGVVDLVKLWPRSQAALAPIAILGLGCCLATTSWQLKYWKDNTSLYEHALKVTSGNYVAHSNLADTLKEKGKLDEAMAHYREVNRLKPSAAKPYNNLGTLYAMQDKLDDAIPLFTKALKLDSKLEQAHFNLGRALFMKGKTEESIAELKTALRLDPDDIEPQKKLAEVLMKSGRAEESLPYSEAVVKAEPDDAHAHFALGSACLATHRMEQAVASFKEALRLSPDTPQCMNSLAWIYATCPKAELRNGPEAVRLATRACETMKPRNPVMLDTLAAAYAEAGRFEDAIKTTEEIRALAISSHDTAMADTAQQRLELYKSGKPYRDDQ